MARKHNAPRQHNPRLPQSRGEPLLQQIAGDFEDDVADEVDTLDPVVFVGRHFQFGEDVARFADLEHFDCCGVCVVDLSMSASFKQISIGSKNISVEEIGTVLMT